jgi:AcrR family transcriptional regulator
MMVRSEHSLASSRRSQTRQQRRFNRTRAKLIAAARSVFVEKGLDLATVDDITERADLGRGTFYYHFGSMSDLISETIKSVLDELAAEIENRCRDKTELSELLDALIAAHIDFFSKRWEDFVLYYQGRSDLTLGQSYDGLETPFMDYLATIERLVDESISQPIPDVVLRRMGCAIAGFISGYYSFAVVSSEGEDVDAAFRSLRSAFVSSLVRFVREALPDTGKKRRQA